MSLRSTARAFPQMLRTGFADAIAYRAEMFIWVLSTTMPFVMMALWRAVARDAPVGRFDQTAITGYFLAAFVTRQLAGAWAAWMINMEVKQGTLAMRLLRPVSPLWAYAAENLGFLPLRILLVLPVLVVARVVVGPDALPRTALGVLLWVVALFGGWLITFLVNVCIGALALFMESSLKIMDVWLAMFFVFSGYLYPVEFFPPGLRAAMDWLPFRYQMGLPTELMINAHGTGEALGLLARQWLWVAALAGLAALLWRRGLRRFAAFGG